jgi:hypothetical protein
MATAREAAPRRECLFEARGLGRGPYSIPCRLIDRGTDHPADRAARKIAQTFRVVLGACDCCTGPDQELFLVVPQGGRAFLACRDCVRATGSKALNQKIAWLDHERRRLVEDHERAAERHRLGYDPYRPRESHHGRRTD